MANWKYIKVFVALLTVSLISALFATRFGFHDDNNLSVGESPFPGWLKMNARMTNINIMNMRKHSVSSEEENHIQKNNSNAVHKDVIDRLAFGERKLSFGTRQNRDKQADQCKVGLRSQQSSRVIYAMPIYALGRGPVSLYSYFRRTLAFAAYYNFSLAVQQFHNKMPQAKPRTNGTFEETFNLERLSQYMSVMSMEAFKDKCGSKIEKIVTLPYNENHTDLCDKYTLLTCQYKSVRIPNKFAQLIPIKDYQASAEKHAANNTECIGILSSELHPHTPCKQELDEFVDTALRRAKYVTNMADNLFEDICQGRFAVVHWRNKTMERVKSKFYGTSLLKIHDVLPEIVKGIVHALQDRNVTCLYIAKRPFEQEFEIVMRKTKIQVYTMTDVLQMSPEIQKYEDDNYIISLLEQELAERCILFFSSRSSNWSYYVEYTRRTRKKETIGLQDLPNVPDLTSDQILR